MSESDVVLMDFEPERYHSEDNGATVDTDRDPSKYLLYPSKGAGLANRLFQLAARGKDRPPDHLEVPKGTGQVHSASTPPRTGEGTPAFFDPDKLLDQKRERARKEQEQTRPQDEENLVIAGEIAEMGREFTAAMIRLGVNGGRGGDLWVVDARYSVDRLGAYRHNRVPESSGQPEVPSRPFEPYRPGMTVSLSGLRDSLRESMEKALQEAAAEKLKREGQGGGPHAGQAPQTEEDNLRVAREITEMGREYAAAMEGLGVKPDKNGFWDVEGEHGEHFVNREGSYLVQTMESGRPVGYRRSLTAYHPGMAIALSEVRDSLRRSMEKALGDAAAKHALQEGQQEGNLRISGEITVPADSGVEGQPMSESAEQEFSRVQREMKQLSDALTLNEVPLAEGCPAHLAQFRRLLEIAPENVKYLAETRDWAVKCKLTDWAANVPGNEAWDGFIAGVDQLVKEFSAVEKPDDADLSPAQRFELLLHGGLERISPGNWGTIAPGSSSWSGNGTIFVYNEEVAGARVGLLRGLNLTPELVSLVGEINNTLIGGSFWLVAGQGEGNWQLIWGHKMPWAYFQSNEFMAAYIGQMARIAPTMRENYEERFRSKFGGTPWWSDDLDPETQGWALTIVSA